MPTTHPCRRNLVGVIADADAHAERGLRCVRSHSRLAWFIMPRRLHVERGILGKLRVGVALGGCSGRGFTLPGMAMEGGTPQPAKGAARVWTPHSRHAAIEDRRHRRTPLSKDAAS